MRLVTLALVCAVFAMSARAQTPPPPFDPAIAAQVSAAQTALQATLPGPRPQLLSDDEIKAKLATLPPIQAGLADSLSRLTPHLQDINVRLTQLGPAPGAGQPAEPAVTTATRHNLTRVRQALDGEVKLARLLSVEADQNSRILVEQLHENFSARLWMRHRSILDPILWADVSRSFPSDLRHLRAVADDEGRRFSEASARRGAPLLLAIGLIVGLLLLVPARFILNRMGLRRATAAPSGIRLRRSGVAMWLVAVATLTPLLAGVAVDAALVAADALTEDFAELIWLAIRAAVFAAFLEGLGRALLSPRRPSLRLAPLGDEGARRLGPYPALVGAVTGLSGFVAGTNAAVGASLATGVASDCVGVLLELVVAGAALLALARVRTALLTSPAERDEHHGSRAPWIVAALGAWLSLGAVLIAIVAGYLALATFLMRETIWIAAVLAALFLASRFVDDFFPALLSEKSAPGRVLRGVIGFSESATEQTAVLASGLFRLVLLALAWAAILAPFGAGLGDVAAHLTPSEFSLKIGQVTVTPSTVLGAVGLFLVGLIVTRAVRGWLEACYLPKTHMDVGVRNSVAVAVSYLGVILAAVLSSAYLGLSFNQIALFASALSVGIGFGLQAIIGNFVSGLILLAERPIKVGDWIAIGDLEGDVKAIHIRATEIEMPDRSRLLVPNSDLVSKTVRNVTHSGAIGRVKIVLRVDNRADPNAVRELILTRLNGHVDVLSEPPPAVYLTDARDGALEFTAFGFVASARYAFRVKSELLFQIAPDLKASGVALASSATVVNVGLSDRPIEPTADAKPA